MSMCTPHRTEDHGEKRQSLVQTHKQPRDSSLGRETPHGLINRGWVFSQFLRSVFTPVPGWSLTFARGAAEQADAGEGVGVQ